EERVTLKGLSVRHAYLEGIDLSKGDLEASHFDVARLARSVFRSADISFAHFDHARMQHANLYRSRARSASFFRAFLNDADFTYGGVHACVTGTLAYNHPLRAAPARPPPVSTAAPLANLGPADFDRSPPASETVVLNDTLTAIESDRRGANLYDASFNEASLQRARFCGAYLYEARFEGADAIGAKFVAAAARYASFRAAVLESADFRDADLTRADFTGACLLGADFTGARLGGAIFNGARLGLDPNQHPTTFGAQADRNVTALGRVTDHLWFEPHAARRHGARDAGGSRIALVAYDVAPNGSRLRAKRMTLGSGELPPSCPEQPEGTVPRPVAEFGED
ncbi:MAG TPA: pentapeptide repeat-containing protein, partial [Candidatus Elarobacter sp.]|nr:pentapeptide repeat-containing protein [Candidatus Elarobacter sp.]